MRIRKKDTEEFIADQSSVLRHFLPEDSSFSVTVLNIDGTHENSSDAEIAYYVLEGDGIVKKEGEITELEGEDVYYAGKTDHILEGNMRLLVIRTPPAEKPEEQL